MPYDAHVLDFNSDAAPKRLLSGMECGSDRHSRDSRSTNPGTVWLIMAEEQDVLGFGRR